MSIISSTCLSALIFLVCCAWMQQASSQSDAVAQLAPNGELRAALIVSNPVLVTRTPDGQLGGVSVELAGALAAKLGVPVHLVPYENPARYTESLGKDEWDIGLAARDPSRAEFLVFSDVFMEVDNGYVGRPGQLMAIIGRNNSRLKRNGLQRTLKETDVTQPLNYFSPESCKLRTFIMVCQDKNG